MGLEFVERTPLITDLQAETLLVAQHRTTGTVVVGDAHRPVKLSEITSYLNTNLNLSNVAYVNQSNVFSVNQIFNSNLTLQNTLGITFSPGSDIDTDLITVNVTGTPKIYWDESDDAIVFSKDPLVVRFDRAGSGHYWEFQANSGGNILVGSGNKRFEIRTSGATSGINDIYLNPETGQVTINEISPLFNSVLHISNKSVSPTLDYFVIGSSAINSLNEADRIRWDKDGQLSLGYEIGDPEATIDASRLTAITNSIEDVAILRLQSSGSITNNFGVGIKLQLETDSVTNRDASRIASIWNDADDSMRSADIVFYNVNNASALAEKARITSDGYIDAQQGFTIAGSPLSLGLTVDTLANILASSPSIGDQFFSSDTTEYIVYDSANFLSYAALNKAQTFTQPQTIDVPSGSALDVNSNSANVAEFHSSGNNRSYFTLRNQVPQVTYFGQDSGIAFYGSRNTVHVDNLIVRPDGKVGIGTTGPSTKLHLIDEDAVTNTITDIFTVGHNTTGVVASGFGTGIKFQAESLGGADHDIGRLIFSYSDVTDTDESSDFIVESMSDGSLSQIMRIAPNINGVFIGIDAGDSVTIGNGNLAIGPGALKSVISNVFNVAIGNEALRDNKGNFNVAIGYNALRLSGTGSDSNVAIGYAAMDQISGDNNVGIGSQVLGSTTAGDRNTGIGAGALDSLINGSDNVAIGYNSGGQETGSNKLYIANTDTITPLIYGEFDNAILRNYGSFEVIKEDAITSAVTDIATFGHNSTGIVTSGFGVGLLFQAESLGGPNHNIGQLTFAYTDVTDGSEDSDFAISLISGGSLTERLWLTSAGWLGLNTTPSSPFHLNGGPFEYTYKTDTSQNTFKMGSGYELDGTAHASGGYKYYIRWGSGGYGNSSWSLIFGTDANKYIEMMNNTITFGDQDIFFQQDVGWGQSGSGLTTLLDSTSLGGSPNAGGITFGNGTGWKFHFGHTSLATKLVTIQDNGQVGFGTDSPIAHIQIDGQSDIPQLLLKMDSGQTSNAFEVQDNSGNDLLVINSSGHIGIGTAPSASTLIEMDAASINNAGFNMTDGPGGDSIVAFQRLGSSGTHAQVSLRELFGVEQIRFRTNSNSYIIPNLFGLGTSSPAYKLDVVYSDAITNSGTAIAAISHNSSGIVAPGFATDLLFRGESLAGSNHEMMSLSAKYTDVGDGSEAADLAISLVSGGSLTERLWLFDDGTMRLGAQNGDARLELYETASTGGYLRFDGTANKFRIGTTGAGDLLVMNRDNSEINVNGDLGIGIDSPTASLDIFRTTETASLSIRATGSGDEARLNLYEGSLGWYARWINSSNQLRMGTSIGGDVLYWNRDLATLGIGAAASSSYQVQIVGQSDVLQLGVFASNPQTQPIFEVYESSGSAFLSATDAGEFNIIHSGNATIKIGESSSNYGRVVWDNNNNKFLLQTVIGNLKYAGIEIDQEFVSVRKNNLGAGKFVVSNQNSIVEPNAQAQIIKEDSLTNSGTAITAFTHNSSGVVAPGFATDIEFRGESLAGPDHEMMLLSAEYETVTSGSEDAAFVIELVRGGTMTERFRLNSAPQTGYTTFTNLSTDRTLDADSTTVEELADVLGTLIEDLKATNIISA